MRDYLEELLAGTEDALDQAEAEWTEGVSPPLPRRSRERPEAAGGPAEPERSAGAEETARGWEKLDRNRAGGAVSIRRDRGGCWSPGSGRNSRKVRQGEDGPVRPPTGGG